MPSCSERLGCRVSEADVLARYDFHYSGGDFAILRRNTAGMRGTQDRFLKVVLDQENIITHDFGTVPQCPKENFNIDTRTQYSFFLSRLNPHFSTRQAINTLLSEYSAKRSTDTLEHMNPLDPRLKRFMIVYLGTWFAEGLIYVKNSEDEQVALKLLEIVYKGNKLIPDTVKLTYF